jgi:hypothetical protein
MKPKYHPQKIEKSPRRQKLFYENLELDIIVDDDFEESLQEENDDINIKDYL